MRRTKWLLLLSSLATLALLGAAAWEENVGREWRRLQREYAGLLPSDRAAEFRVQLRQVVVPSIRAADRCVTCHVGMAPGEEGIPGHRVFGKHAPLPHDPSEFGCTVCHAGQGRATESDAAHGRVPHWPEPMLPREASHAGCGTCHTHLAVPDASRLARGRDLVERLDCLACHALDGRGGTLRPGGAAAIDGGDLSRVGATRYDRDWYGKHLAKRESDPAPAWRTSFGPIGEEARRDLATFLDSRVGAPGLLEAKSLFHSVGCRGCHKVWGVGGDDGPDLTRVGEKDPGRLDWSHVPGERTLANWIAQHFRDPAGVAPGSAMPALGLSEGEIEALTFYMLSLRAPSLPEAFWPNDRIRAERFGEREFAADGATLYAAFCSACHGPNGEGMRYPGIAAFPAVASPDFLALAPDALIAETIRKGRPGRRMPAWGSGEGGLRPEEIEAVVAHVRALGGVEREPDPRPPRWVAADAESGKRVYALNCASCHGAGGEGAEGPALRNPVLLAAATDTYLVETVGRGRRGTSMPSYRAGSPTHRQLSEEEIREVVAFLRTWEETR